MFALHARFRGRTTRRADYVRRSAEALSSLPGITPVQIIGVEDITSTATTPRAMCDLIMALLSDGQWALGIGITEMGNPAPEVAVDAAGKALGRGTRAGTVGVRIAQPVGAGMSAGEIKQAQKNIAAAFTLLGQVLAKRTFEGREATSLVRSGLSQNEAAAQLGISKQAMSQRLQAAGWQAETMGWDLTVNLLAQAEKLR